MAWTWQFEYEAGAATPTPEESDPHPTQADAESWIGEEWPALREKGIVRVSLYEDRRKVYGPMSLEPPADE